jgi:hypothetical protein
MRDALSKKRCWNCFIVENTVASFIEVDSSGSLIEI